MHRKAAVIACAALALAGCGGTKPVAATTLTSTVEVTKTVTVTAPPTAIVPKTVMETDGTYRIVSSCAGRHHQLRLGLLPCGCPSQASRNNSHP